MYSLIHLTTTSLTHNSSTSRSPLRSGFLFIALALAWFALLPAARAVSPPPDGAYPNGNTAEGDDALLSLTTGKDNTAIGEDALKNNITGSGNTATGANALKSSTDRDNITAYGLNALSSNTSGNSNTAIGANALQQNTSASDNTAVGIFALTSNRRGDENTAVGAFALSNNRRGIGNTAIGNNALSFNNSSSNTAIGDEALASNSGTGNTAVGTFALQANGGGNFNTAIGLEALGGLEKGSNNIALGRDAGNSLQNGSNTIYIGNGGVGGSNTIAIGTVGTHKNTFIAGISGVTVAGGVGVIIDSNGHLGTVTSSERFKDEIKPMDKASDAILALQPVTFHYKHELDPAGIPQFGLVAEQVEKVNPDLVARDEQGKVYSVRYEAVNAMLLNEFLKEHQKGQEQDATITQLKSTVTQQQKDFLSAMAQQEKEIKALTASLKEQASQIQRVSEALEVSKAAPQLVANNQ